MGFMAVLPVDGTCFDRSRKATDVPPRRARRGPRSAAAPRRATSPVDSPLDRTQHSIRSTEDPMTQAPPQIGYDDFLKVDVRVGRIVQVDDFPKAKKPAYRLRIDFGELGVKTSSVQLTRHYRNEDLARRLVLAVVHFPPRQIADYFSEVLTLGVMLGEVDVVLVQPDRDVPPGSRILQEKEGVPLGPVGAGGRATRPPRHDPRPPRRARGEPRPASPP